MRRRLLSLGAKLLSSSSTPISDIRVLGASRLLSTSTSCTPGIAVNYNSLVKRGVLQPDLQQENVVAALDNLLQQLAEYEKKMEFYHTQLKEWETQRHRLRQELLQEEAEKVAKRVVEKKQAAEKKSFLNSVSRWYKQLKERLLQHEAERERQWELRAYGLATSNLVSDASREKRSNRQVEAGSGKMVAHINREKRLDQLAGPRPSLPPSPKGLYIYGSVGCGKTMLMDMFYNAAEGVVNHRRRLHFHSALLEVHDWMHKLWKQQQEKKMEYDTTIQDDDDLDALESQEVTMKNTIKKWLDNERKFQEDFVPSNILDMVAEYLLSESLDSAKGGASLLCFDEMQVVDVFTAVALAGIFTALIKKGAVVVLTSNRAPTDLNKEGMQKELFNKFISELQQHCHLILLGSEIDYRRLLAADEKSDWKNYFWPLNKDAHDALELRWQQLVSEAGGKVVQTTVPVMFGRTLEVPQSCSGVARFSFEEICDRPVGAADYLAVARNFHTVFITGIPVMSMRNRDKARRFITLVDELYNHRRQMICTAETSIDELFLGSEEGFLVDLESLQFETEAENTRLRRDVTLSGSVAPVASSQEEKRSIQSLLSGREELFAFQRAVSRLTEMQSALYLHGQDFHTHQHAVESVGVQKFLLYQN
ncbi:hypothetical protein GOP47_0022245 [Adiantum capillus-veneris]|uniref:Lactation elevated protein 1 n=1 Tax=Adiantum capillus-veneris TaxID=13818 RepID=A0A9D4Z601_ADICA|nr:hypothetical protein GOP47_0022245 [Adiantum capillus-veneris]